MSMRKVKVASSGIVSTPHRPHLGQHFVKVAEEAQADGDDELAIHFLELALKAFDEVFGQNLRPDPDPSDISRMHVGFMPPSVRTITIATRLA